MKNYNVLDYGACEGRLCTSEIQAAFDAANDAPGTVVIPPGVYQTGSINMRGASLYLEKGARLLASGSMADYPPIGYNHNEIGEVRSLLYSMNTKGVSISGEGVIDLNGDVFFDLSLRAVPEGKVPFNEEQINECAYRVVKSSERPNQPVFFYNCQRVTVRGVTMVDSPCYSLAFVECSDIRILDVTIDNGLCIPNCDGIHIGSCEDVYIRGCTISSGDDCIALTAIPNWEKPCQRVIITDCVLRTSSKGIQIGYMHSVVRDVLISNCVIYESNRALVVMSSPGTGLVENVIVSNLRLDTRIRAGYWWGNGEPVCLMGVYHHNDHHRDKMPDRSFPVCIRNILFENLICSGENVIAVIGERGSVEDIRFDNLTYERKDSKNLPLKGRMVDLAPGEQTAWLPNNEKHYWLFIKEANDITIKNTRVSPYHGEQLAVCIESGERIVMDYQNKA